MFAVLLEPLYKHGQYVGFYIPRFVKTFFSVIIKNKKVHDLDEIRGFFMVIIACGLIGLAHSRGYYDKIHITTQKA